MDAESLWVGVCVGGGRFGGLHSRGRDAVPAGKHGAGRADSRTNQHRQHLREATPNEFL